MTNEARRAEIQARLEKATPGPWRAAIALEGTQAASVDDILSGDKHVVCFGHDYDDYGYMRPEDAEFTAHAREDIPWLLAELSRLSEAQQPIKVHRRTRPAFYVEADDDELRLAERADKAEAEVSRLSEAQKVRALPDEWRYSAQASSISYESRVLEQCANDLDAALARLTAAPEAQPEGAFARAVRFQVEKNDIISAVYESHATTEEGIAIETLLCDTVNRFMDDAFPGWRERPSTRLTAAPNGESR